MIFNARRNRESESNDAVQCASHLKIMKTTLISILRKIGNINILATLIGVGSSGHEGPVPHQCFEGHCKIFSFEYWPPIFRNLF